MGVKKLLRDLVFIYIAINLIRIGGFNLVFYGILMIIITAYFYVGKK